MEKGSPSGKLRELYRFMAARSFVADRGELTSAGFPSTQIDSWLRTGRLIKILFSVYAYGRDVDGRLAALRAALLASGPGSALIGRSACEQWGLIRAEDGIPRLVEVGSPIGQTRKLRGLSPSLRRMTILVSKRRFSQNETRLKDGLILVRPALALIGFAAKATEREIRFSFLEACRLGLFTQRDLEYCYRAMEGRRGAKKLRPYLALWVPELKRIRSVLEGWFLLIWVKRKLPMPRVNEKHYGYELDFFWPELQLVLETDGDSFHRDPAQSRIDLEKQRHLEANGLTVVRLGSKEFAADPEGNVDWIAGLVAARQTRD